MNLTLCSNRFNRDIKKTKLPSELANHEEILDRISEWKNKYEMLDRQIRKVSTKGAASKEEKDSRIKWRHLLSLQRDYWRGKYQRFIMTEVPEGFSRRQGTDISVISRYARMYLKSVFKHVYIVKGIATSDFRKMWGIQDEYTKKERVNHVHHCIDAITIACIDKTQYNKLAQYYHKSDEYKYGLGEKPVFDKPWPTFVSDIKQIQDELLIAHYSKDHMPKQAKRRVRGSKGGKVLTQGDTARASLHNETYYGAIEFDGGVKYVVRKNLDSINEKDVKNIVDKEVRSRVENAILLHGSLKNALEQTIWMNEKKQIPIKKVRMIAGSVTRPIHIRQQRDQSKHEYKRQYHVQNDRNYMMAIYIGHDKKGKEKREFELVNNITAAAFYRRSNDRVPTENRLVPLFSKSGYELRYQLKIGTMVILYENTPEEVWELDRKNLQKRLYKVTGMSSMVIQNKYEFGTIELIHHQNARPSSDVKKVNGIFSSNEGFRPGIKMLHTQFNALVEGVDFKMNDLGEIIRLI
jgi:CRISPR-associated endonuclease Csn1